VNCPKRIGLVLAKFKDIQSHKVDCKTDTVTIIMKKDKKLTEKVLKTAFKIQPKYKIQKFAQTQVQKKAKSS